MDTFIFAVNAVLPLVILIVIGYFLKRTGLCSAEFFKQANKLVFKLFLPIMLFLGVYKIDDLSQINLGAVLFAIGALTAIFFLGLAVALIFIKDTKQRGAVWQCVFRSNYAILGIPLAEQIAGVDGLIAATILSAVIVPCFNVFAVIALSIFRGDGKKTSVKSVLLGIVKNPLIHGVLIGLLALLVRAVLVYFNIDFRLSNPNSNVRFIYKTLTMLSNVTTPIALIVLGGQFEFKSLKNSKYQIAVATITRLIVVPAFVLFFACAVFKFSGAVVASFIVAFASPVAVSSAVMAEQMDSDGELAGSLVVSTTVGSVLTLTIIIAICRALTII